MAEEDDIQIIEEDQEQPDLTVGGLKRKGFNQDGRPRKQLSEEVKQQRRANLERARAIKAEKLRQQRIEKGIIDKTGTPLVKSKHEREVLPVLSVIKSHKKKTKEKEVVQSESESEPDSPPKLKREKPKKTKSASDRKKKKKVVSSDDESDSEQSEPPTPKKKEKKKIPKTPEKPKRKPKAIESHESEVKRTLGKQTTTKQGDDSGFVFN